MADAQVIPAQPETVALFISDLHLQTAMPRTAEAFFTFLRNHATKCRQLYLLGDVFEYWAGDDDISTPFNQHVVDAIRKLSDLGIQVFWIAGNRDFLVAEEFEQATGATRLPDPFVTIVAGIKLVLTHGDAHCTDDIEYMAFRAQVRQPGWQQTFLAMPLAQRKAIIEGLRNDSRLAQQSKTYEIMDVNAGAIESLFESTETSFMIHGHTHRPAQHEHFHRQKKNVRFVLPDWDCDTAIPRGGWIAITSDGAIKRMALNGIEIV